MTRRSIRTSPLSPPILPVASGLDGLLSILDETGITIADPATSAAQILADGGVFQNSEAFIAL